MTLIPTAYIFNELSKHQMFALPMVGQIYIFKYKYYQHDMTPMVIPFKLEPKYSTFQAINLHYLHPEVRLAVYESLAAMKLVHPISKEIVFDYSILQQFFKDVSVCLRRYKHQGVEVARHVPNKDFLKKHWKSPGAMEQSFRKEMHTKSLNVLRVRFNVQKGTP